MRFSYKNTIGFGKTCEDHEIKVVGNTYRSEEQKERSEIGRSSRRCEETTRKVEELREEVRSTNLDFMIFTGLSKSNGVLVRESHVFRLRGPDTLQGNEREGNLTINTDVQSFLVFQVEVPLLFNSRESVEGSHFPVVSLSLTTIQLQVNIGSKSIAFLNSQLPNLLL